MTEPGIVRTRFAPSPSGHLHVGGARTALFCRVYAAARGGRMIVRIEDTDRKRSSDAAGLAFLDDLAWLGVDWDEGPEHDGCGGGATGPYYQSQRRSIYDEHVERLVATGRAYPAFETPEELDESRSRARAAKQDYRYDRAGLRLDDETVRGYLAEGRPHVIRVKAPDAGTLSFHDQVRGDVEIDAGALDDFVIRKADGFPTYHLAVVVDDALMGVTHVIRGDEHLNNTFRHLVLQEALGVPRPVYAHLSVITNPDGSKMSKRDKDKALRAAVRQRGLESSEAVDAETWAWWLESKDHQLPIERAAALAHEIGIELPSIEIDDFRRAGYLPEVMVNYLALLGWSPGGDVEKFDRDFLVERFDFDRVIRSPAKFDRDKLLAFNLDALQELPEDAFVERLVAHARCYHPEYVETLGPSRLELFARANRKRSKTLEDPFRDGGFFLTDDEALEFERSKGVRKALGGEPSGADLLAGVRAVLASLDPWTPEAIERAVDAFAEERAGGKLGRIAQPLRVAVCGGTVSPPIFETLAILGRDSTVRRIDRCLDARAELCAT